MFDQDGPGRGVILTYLDPRSSEDMFTRAVTIGPAVLDPRTREPWVPVLRPDRTKALVDQRRIVDSVPATMRLGARQSLRDPGNEDT